MERPMIKEYYEFFASQLRRVESFTKTCIPLPMDLEFIREIYLYRHNSFYSNNIDSDFLFITEFQNDQIFRKRILEDISKGKGNVNYFLFNLIIFAYLSNEKAENVDYFIDTIIDFIIKFSAHNGDWITFDDGPVKYRYYIGNEFLNFSEMFMNMVLYDPNKKNAYYVFFMVISSLCHDFNPKFASFKNVYLTANSEISGLFLNCSLYKLQERLKHNDSVKYNFSAQNLLVGNTTTTEKDFVKETECLITLDNLLNKSEKPIDSYYKSLKKKAKQVIEKKGRDFTSQRNKLLNMICDNWEEFQIEYPTAATTFLFMSTKFYEDITFKKPKSIQKYLVENGIDNSLYECYLRYWEVHDEEKREEIKKIAKANSIRQFHARIAPVKKLSEMAVEKGSIDLEDIVTLRPNYKVTDLEEIFNSTKTNTLVESGVDKDGLIILKRTVKRYSNQPLFKLDFDKWTVAGEEVTYDTAQYFRNLLKECDITPYKILVSKCICQFIKCGHNMDEFLNLNHFNMILRDRIEEIGGLKELILNE